MQPERTQPTLDAWQAFLTTPLDATLARASGADPAEAALALFQTVAATVPAYRSFLAEHGVEPADIQSSADFKRLPPTTKQTYQLRYPLAELCRDGRLESCDFIAASSGSTGKPTFWPRFISDELQIAARFEQIFHDSFRADERRTLAVVCFSLGTWVGGMFTASCCRHLAARGYPITVVSPGNNMAEILRVVQRLAPEFEQTVLLGYPPFLKDVIDAGIASGVD